MAIVKKNLGFSYFSKNFDKLLDLRSFMRTMLNTQNNHDMNLIFHHIEGWTYLRKRALNLHHLPDYAIDDVSLGYFILSFGSAKDFLRQPIYKVTPTVCAITYVYLLNERFNFLNVTESKCRELLSQLFSTQVSWDDPSLEIFRDWCTHQHFQIQAAMRLIKEELGERTEAMIREHLNHVSEELRKLLKLQLTRTFGNTRKTVF